jgi:hypothetical protein
MHMIIQQAAIDLQHSTEDGAYITEQEIDNYLIANHKDEEGEMERTLAAQQKYDATVKMIREANAKEGFYHEGARTRTWPKPVPVRTPPVKHDWDFFYRSLLQATPETRSAILATMCSGTTPVFKSELRIKKGNHPF